MIIAIIGAGASGMAAAIAASESAENKIILLEKQGRVGKKLQATGNGRCNLSNLGSTIERYHGENPHFAKYALKNYSPSDTLTWFRDLGLFTTVEDSGRVYPYSDQANSVVDILRFALNKPNIELRTDFEVVRIRKGSGKFILETKEGQLTCDRVIIAAGGLAGTKLGGSLSGYKLLQGLGHHATRLRPALVQIKAEWQGLRALKGVRANCRAAIRYNDKEQIASEGELQFTDYGLSGPVIFEISRDVCAKNGKWEAEIDFLPQISADQLHSTLLSKKSSNLISDDLLTGILHNRLGKVLIKEAGIPFGLAAEKIEIDYLKKLCKHIKSLRITLKEPMGMDQAQVTAGGICTADFDPQTMESRIVPGIFACGEVLDIDGDCGGYNLQWAWSSGRLAGFSASKKS